MSNEFSTPKLNPADNVKIPGVDGNNDSGYLLSEEVKDYMVGGVYGTTPEYSTLETYSVGERVMNEGVLYRCITAVSTPEVFNPTKWTKIDLPTMDSAITSLSKRIKSGYVDFGASPAGVQEKTVTFTEPFVTNVPNVVLTWNDSPHQISGYVSDLNVKGGSITKNEFVATCVRTTNSGSWRARWIATDL